MTLPSDLKMGKFLEWYTELPYVDRPRISPVFLIQNKECYFECTTSKGGNICLALMPKMTCIKLKPFSLVISCNYRESDNFIRSYQTVSGWSSWIYIFDPDEIKEKGPCEGYFVKFCFLFENPGGSSFSLEAKIEDKSIQTGSYLNAEVSVESSYEDFSKLLDAGSNHDAEIKCGKHTIKVHRIILSARSEVFSKMLQSDMKEGRSGIIEIKGIDISYVQDFVRYLYTGAMPELTFDKAKMLYEAGDKYAVRSLMIRCSEYLQDNLSPENAVQCFALADAHSDQNLKDRVKTYMLEKKVYLQDELMLPFSESFPREAIEVYRLSHKRKASEMDDP